MNLLHNNSIVLYNLKKAFGQQAELLKPADGVTDYATGQVIRTYTHYVIKNCILMPTKSSRALAFDKMVFGNYEVGVRNAIVDAKEISVTIEPDDRIQFSSETYIVVSAEKTEDIGGYLLKLKKIRTV